MLVSNSSTLILLAKVSLLKKVLGNYQMSIPLQVARESTEDKQDFTSKIIQKEIDDNKIITKSVDAKDVQKVLTQFRLHEGEASAYVLFKKGGSKAILTDDLELIKLCKLYRVPFICALAVVVRMYERNMLTREEALDKLDSLREHGWYSDKVFNYFNNKVR